jgi:hypothetical protein
MPLCPAAVLPRANLPFPGSLPEFQRLFRDDPDSAAYLEAIGLAGRVRLRMVRRTWRTLPRRQPAALSPGRNCQRDNALTAGTVMERTRTARSI